MSRLRVLVLTKTTALGGAERLVMNGLPHLDRERFDYRFAAFDDGGPLARACLERGDRFAALPAARAGDPRPLLALRRLLVHARIDVVHAHLPVPGALARLAARGTQTSVVYTEHATQDSYRPTSRWLNARSYGWQEIAIAVSDRVRESAEMGIGRAARERLAVVRNGVDFDALERGAARLPDPSPPARPGAVTVLVPANLTPLKGHAVLLQALARPGPVLDLWLAGEGPERAGLAARAGHLPHRVRVHFLGTRADVFALMGAADVVALPSRREGLPLALLEALSLGRPTLATAVGGIPEVVTHAENGWLVPPGDPDALAAGLARLAEDPGLRKALGGNARRSARRSFDIRDSVVAVEALYRRAWERRGQAAASARST